MTALRDEFAMVALTGLISAKLELRGHQIVKLAYQAADNMLKEREQNSGGE